MSERWPPQRRLALVDAIGARSGSEIKAFFGAHGLSEAIAAAGSKPSKLGMINAALDSVRGGRLDELLDAAAEHLSWSDERAISASSGSMSILPVPRTDEQRKVLQAVWDHFFFSDAWPTFKAIDKKLFREHSINLGEVAAEMPADLLRPSRLAYAQDDQLVTLTVAGARACMNSDEDLRLFVAAVRLAAAKWLDAPDDSGPVMLTANDVRAPELPAAGRDQMLTRLGQMFTVENWPWSGVGWSPPPDSNWSVTVDGRIRALLDVPDLETYWKITRPVSSPPPSPVSEVAPMPDRIFLVHGHDSLRHEVARFVEKVFGIEPIILDEQPSKSRTVIEKFEDYGGGAGYAIVLLTPDDLGRAVGAAEDKARARQNVVFEFGYFCGSLGRERVVAIRKDDVEQPSDIAGVVYIPYPSGDWKIKLARELEAAGFDLNAKALLA